jgi:hypothetical protein
MKTNHPLRLIWGLLLALAQLAAQAQPTVSLTKAALRDKIKGGWAGQLIGCTFGGPTEFRYNGTMINDYQPIPWYDGYLKHTMEHSPGLYDDIYMDLTFVDVFEKEGLDAPVASHARAYANADYLLWHANQVGRYNILNGIMPPASGHWLNNPQADAIDFQIEADFAGLMAPGMPNTATEICDRIGHIMNYGDGWYGGVYMAAMYSLAFTYTDIQKVVKDALGTIPPQSDFHRCVADVIRWHGQYPNDWTRTWWEVQKKWSSDRTCPEGVFAPFNIDATVNAAYVVMGLLYGNGDYAKTLEISTRCGQDSDCNPASAGGILGTLLGYDRIPAYWKMGLAEAEGLDFKYTTLSLNEVYDLSLKHALQVVARHGGQVQGDQVVLRPQKPQPAKLEQGFPGHFPTEKRRFYQKVKEEASFEFEGVGFVVMGAAERDGTEAEHVYEAQLWIDGQMVEQAKLPTTYKERRFNLFWRYQLPKGKHQVRVKLLNPSAKHHVHMTEIVVFGDQPVANAWKK